jgi:hypothetical protein
VLDESAAGGGTWRSRHGLAIAVLACVGLFQVTTIREGHGWGDDFAQYVLHARNLATGQPYAPTGYLVNPEAIAVGPAAYPPGTGILLTPIYARYGLAFGPMKTAMALLIVVALAGVHLVFHRRLSRANEVLLLAAIGFNPVLWRSKDAVGSDLLFLALCFLTLAGAQAVARHAGPVASRAALGVPLGLGIYAATATRSIGVVLVGAVLVHGLLQRRTSALVAPGVAAVLAIALMAVQRAWLPIEGVYAQWFQDTFSIGAPLVYARQYVGELRGFVENDYSLLAATGVFFTIAGLAAVGAWTSLRREIGVVDCFVVLYAGMILLFPPVQRYLLPILPPLFFYAFTGATVIGSAMAGGRHWAPTAVLAGLLAVTYAGAYSRAAFGPIEDGATQPQFAELCAFIRANTDPADRFIFRKPRALALFAHRATAPFAPETDAAALDRLIAAIGARYLITANLRHPEFEMEQTTVMPLVAARPDRFTAVFANERFTLYRIQ